jgi:hypothetical protein
MKRGLKRNNELEKLDNMLFKYLEGNKSTKKETREIGRRKNEYKLMSIEEEEADFYSLPRSQGSEISLKWFKD